MSNHRLWGMRCYLCGAMDRVADYGVGWRKEITPFLEKKGVIVLDPCDKPIPLANELEDRVLRRQLISEEEYAEVSRMMHIIRVVDLRMIDMSDFIIARVDRTVHMCGSYEEITWANRMKKPIIIWCPDGKDQVPDWLWGTLPYQHVFKDWPDIEKYLTHIHHDDVVDDLHRWMFFDFTRIVPKVTVEESESVV